MLFGRPNLERLFLLTNQFRRVLTSSSSHRKGSPMLQQVDLKNQQWTWLLKKIITKQIVAIYVPVPVENSLKMPATVLECPFFFADFQSRQEGPAGIDPERLQPRIGERAKETGHVNVWQSRPEYTCLIDLTVKMENAPARGSDHGPRESGRLAGIILTEPTNHKDIAEIPIIPLLTSSTCIYLIPCE